jgi:hypothetical protein
LSVKKSVRVKTLNTGLKISQTKKELDGLEDQVNRFIIKNKVEKVAPVSDTTTIDHTAGTIGSIRALTGKCPVPPKRDRRGQGAQY